MPQTQSVPAAAPAQVDSAAPAFAESLCAIRGKEGGLAAVEQAAALSGTSGHLTLLAVTSFRSGGAHRGPAIGPTQTAEILDRAAGIARRVGVPYTTEVDPRSPPARVILDWSARYDLLALGAPASSWPAMWLSVGVGDKALREFSCPLLVARPLAEDRRFADRIVVASDGGPASDAIVERALRLAKPHGSRLTLVHALGRESPLRRRPQHEQERTLEQQQRRIEGTLASGMAKIVVEPGRPADVVKALAATEDASLIVMGSRRLDGLRGIGSVSRRVVHQARCSVLLFPPESL